MDMIPYLAAASAIAGLLLAMVRVAEVKESLRLCRAFLDGMPEGPINSGKPTKLLSPAFMRVSAK